MAQQKPTWARQPTRRRSHRWIAICELRFAANRDSALAHRFAFKFGAARGQQYNAAAAAVAVASKIVRAGFGKPFARSRPNSVRHSSIEVRVAVAVVLARRCSLQPAGCSSHCQPASRQPPTRSSEPQSHRAQSQTSGCARTLPAGLHLRVFRVGFIPCFSCRLGSETQSTIDICTCRLCQQKISLTKSI